MKPFVFVLNFPNGSLSQCCALPAPLSGEPLLPLFLCCRELTDTARRVPTSTLKHHEKISHSLCFLLNRRAPNHILHRTPCAGIFLFEKMLPPADFFEKTLAISFWLCYNTSI